MKIIERIKAWLENQRKISALHTAGWYRTRVGNWKSHGFETASIDEAMTEMRRRDRSHLRKVKLVPIDCSDETVTVLRDQGFIPIRTGAVSEIVTAGYAIDTGDAA